GDDVELRREGDGARLPLPHDRPQSGAFLPVVATGRAGQSRRGLLARRFHLPALPARGSAEALAAGAGRQGRGTGACGQFRSGNLVNWFVLSMLLEAPGTNARLANS